MIESDIHNLLNEFRDVAKSHGTAIADGTTKAANRSTRRQEEICKALASHGQGTALLDLLQDENQWVQVFAAIAVIDIDKRAAMQTLRRIVAEGEPLPSLEARTAVLFREGFPGGYQSLDTGSDTESPAEGGAETSWRK